MFKSTKVIVRTVALIALPALFMGESALAAEAVETPPQATVRFADLDLNNTADVATLYKRIRTAATTVCQSVEGPQSVSKVFWKTWNDCFYHGIAHAVRDVHNGKLTAYYEVHSDGWHYPETDETATVASR